MSKIIGVFFLYLFTSGWATAQTTQNSCYWICIGTPYQLHDQLSGSLSCREAADICVDYVRSRAAPTFLTKYSYEVYPLSQTSGLPTCGYNLTATNSQGTQSHYQYSAAQFIGQCVTPPTCTPPAVLTNGQCVNPPPTCTPPSVLSGNQCVCQAPNALVNGVCTKCPVDGLTALGNLSTRENEDAATRALTEALEAGRNGYDLLSQPMKTGEQCLSGGITGLGITYSGPTATVRTVAYQKHLKEIWDKFRALQRKIDENPSYAQACLKVIRDVEAEMGFTIDEDPESDACDTTLGRAHCIVSKPAAGADGKHTKNNAIDIGSGTVNSLETRLKAQTPPRTVTQFANDCNLDWGGLWNPIDRVHFQAR